MKQIKLLNVLVKNVTKSYFILGENNLCLNIEHESRFNVFIIYHTISLKSLVKLT